MTVDTGHARARAVLGAALQFGPDEQAAIAATGLRPEHFDEESHSLIWSAVCALARDSKPHDAVGVFGWLAHQGSAEAAGHLSHLEDLAQGAPPRGQAAGHARALVEQNLASRLAASAAELGARLAIAEPGENARAVVSQLQAALDAYHGERPAAVVFSAVPVLDLETAPPEPQRWYWDGYLPHGHVLLWTGHGGTGKTTMATQLVTHIVVGRPFLGRATQRARVLFFSAEDPALMVRQRLRRICRDMALDPADLAENLHVIDATEMDAALYVEQRVAGLRVGKTTAVYEALARYVDEHAIDVLVLDNASDLFDGDEIVRQLVRGFVRSLVQLVRKRGGAVVLLAHVDKATSRAGRGASSESYSGSTAWHNSARSRVALIDKGDGQLELQHQKCNLGPRQPTVQLTWPAGGLPRMADAETPTPTESRPDAATAMRRLVELVRDFNVRGESVSTSMQGAASPAKLLGGDPRYPAHLRPAAVLDLLRAAERARYLAREGYSGAHRKALERWRVTETGIAWLDNLPLFGSAGEATP